MSPVGGQALISGVMMKGQEHISRAVYSSQGNLIIDKKEFNLLSKKSFIFRLPFIRGVVNLIDMFKIGIDSLMYSVKIAMPEEEHLSKKEFSSSFIFSFLFSITLFTVIPAFGFKYLGSIGFDNILLLNIFEGVIRIIIFLIFLFSTLFMKDMQEIYRYHGAEHKAVRAYEAGVELTVENVKKHSRIHPRCGTAFIAVLMITSVILFSFMGNLSLVNRIVLKILFLPVVAGIAYEIIRINNKLGKFTYLNIFIWPGLLLQKITTSEPGEKEITAAIAALKEVV
jgi:uncharacterized protein YqhQ